MSEHANFKQAEQRLENLHRLRMSKVMRDWEELEQKYQEMKKRSGGEIEAEEFKRGVTSRFQKTIKNLEEEGLAEKRQLLAVHQNRVLSHLNERKKRSDGMLHIRSRRTARTERQQNPEVCRETHANSA